jgi:murein DD-endopeptidase MepM/ murein hydrolase activator NlpD
MATLLTLIFTLICLPSPLFSQRDPACEWHLLYLNIRERLIPKEEAKTKLMELEVLLKDAYSQTSRSNDDDRLYFPLHGYTSDSIGGKRGSGYQVQGYDFFDGNQHKAHPGHDIFIRDRDQDGLDDVTGRPVAVISASPGIVVSVNLNWEPSSPIRGGNYIWVYDPAKNRYSYYAHLKEVFVTIGQRVAGGDRLGTVGRTGTNAYLRRSPTHLHFTVHQSKEGYPKPVNPYDELVTSKR